MDIEANKAVFRSFVEAENRGDQATLVELADPNIIDHGTRAETHFGFESIKSSYNAFRIEYPDMQYSIQDLLADGDRVICRWTLHGTHSQTGEPLTLNGITIDRVVNGKIVEHWANHNRVK